MIYRIEQLSVLRIIIHGMYSRLSVVVNNGPNDRLPSILTGSV